MLTESVLLSCMGGVVGVAIAYLVSAMMLRLAFPRAEFSPIHATPSAQVLGFAFGVSLLTGLLFGMAPAWTTSHAQPAHALRRSTRTSSGHVSLLQRSLVVLQAGLSVILLIGAGLLARSLINLQRQNFGFDVKHRVVVRLNVQNAGYTTAQLQPLYDQMRARMLSLPGVTKVGMALFSPLDGDDWTSTWPWKDDRNLGLMMTFTRHGTGLARNSSTPSASISYADAIFSRPTRPRRPG